MAPIQLLSSQESNAFQVKNTFLHCAPDENELDDDDWIIRRQASEPAPKRQFSDAKRNSAILQAPVLEKCDEEADYSDSDDLELTDSDGLFRQVSVLKRQKSSLANTVAEMDRQLSSISVQGFDKQVSCISAAGFCRQETEMQWPMYAIVQPREPLTLQSPLSELNEAMSLETNSASEGRINVEVLPLDQLIEGPSVDPVSVDAMAAQMNSVIWANMMWKASLVMDQKNGKPTVSERPFGNRRKARSLITQAQEAQRNQQNLRQAQVNVMKQCLEQQPQLADQQQQLEQQLKAWMGMIPDGQQESQAQMPERSRSPEIKQHSQPQGLAAVQAGAMTSEPVAPTNQATGKAQFCPYCGGKVLQRFKFCRYCGEDVSQLWEL